MKALVAFIASKTHLTHYCSKFIPFLDLAFTYPDQDAAWSLKEDVVSDEGYSFVEVGLPASPVFFAPQKPRQEMFM